MRRIEIRPLAVLAAVTLLAGCAAPQPERVERVSAPDIPRDWYAGKESVRELSADNTRVFIKVLPAGPLAARGHPHAVEAGTVEGFAYLPDDLSRARADLSIPVEDLRVDTPAGKEALQVDTELSARQIENTRRNMLATLEAGKFPNIVVRISGYDGHQARADIYLNGTLRSMPVPMEVRSEGANTAITGRFRIRQTQFGIAPYSALNGALQVADELEIVATFKRSR